MTESERKMTGQDGDGRDLTGKAELAFAIEIARGSSVAKAAAKIDVSESTGRRWMKKKQVRDYVEEVRAEVLQSAASKIIHLNSKAISVLDELLSSTSDQVKLSAARAIVDCSFKLRQLADLESHLVAIENKVQELQAQNNRVRRE